MTDPIVVIGAGLSGCLLVQALADTPSQREVLLVDVLEEPTRGRAWAYFEPDYDGLADGLAVRRFRNIRVAGRHGSVLRELTEHHYTVLDGDALAAGTDRALSGHGSRRLGAVAAVDRDHGRVEIDGDALTSGLVLDSVGIGRPGPTPTAWLHFTGWRVRAHHSAFEDDAVTLMDFRTAQRGQLRFVYVLPYSDHTALVELTVLSAVPEPPSDVDQDLDDYLDAALGARAWRAEPAEAGRLPLGTCGRVHRSAWPRPRSVTTVIPIGSAAGLVKPSTGYGVRLMQRDARALAAELGRGRTPRGLRRRRRHRWLDSVFLRLAVSDPDRLRDALEDMFRANPVDRVARFLDEESGPVEELRLIATLPVRPFLRAALSRRRHAGWGERATSPVGGERSW